MRVRTADIHTRAPAHWFQTFENFNIIGSVIVVYIALGSRYLGLLARAPCWLFFTIGL